MINKKSRISIVIIYVMSWTIKCQKYALYVLVENRLIYRVLATIYPFVWYLNTMG